MAPHRSNDSSRSPISAQTIAELVDSELKQCLEHAAEGLHWVDPDGAILWANQTELDLLGYAREEYIGHHIAEFHVDRPVIDDILARLTRGETLLNYDARLRHKDGTIRFVQINSNVLWRDERFLHTRCFTRDVTERRAAHDLERRLAEIVENSDDAIISQDLQGVVTSWNPAAERLYGYAAEEVKGQSIRVIIPPGRESEEAEVVQRVSRGERVPPFDTVGRHKNGSPIPVALTVSPIRDHDGRVVGASTMARDISERKEYGEKIRKNEVFLDSVVENIPNMIFVKDAHHLKFVRFNKAGEKLVGFSRDDMIGKSDYDFFPKDEADFFTKKDREVLKGKNAIDITKEKIKTKFKVNL